MKKILFVITLCPLLSYSQEIEGVYAAGFIGAERIEFKGKDSFYFSGFYCNYGMSGKGICEIRNNYLYLYFEKRDTIDADPLKAPEISKTKSTNNSSTIRITCTDNKGNPLSHIGVEVKARSGVGSVTNSDGRAILKIKSDSPIFTLSTESGGIEPVQMKLEGGYDYEVKIYHKYFDSNREIYSGEVYVYEIDELSEDVIMMRRGGSSGPYLAYKRKG